jgi:drug/metabolite transporter (DMT)-like permease
MQTHLAVIILCFSSIGWGLTWLPIKALNQMGLHTSQIILIAFTSASLVLSPWIYTQRKSWLPALPLMIALCFFGGFANIAFQTALAEGEVIRVMILFYMLPIWSVLGGKIFLNESIDTRRVTALLLCVSGAFCLLEAWSASWNTFTFIDFLALGSGMGLAASNLLFRFTAHIPLSSKIGFMFIGCVILLTLARLILPMIGGSESPWVNSTPLPHNGAVPLAIAYGLCWLMLITFGSQWAVTRIEAGRSAVILVLELVVAVISVVLITQNTLTVYEIIGGTMVLIAALLEGSRMEKKEY